MHDSISAAVQARNVVLACTEQRFRLLRTLLSPSNTREASQICDTERASRELLSDSKSLQIIERHQVWRWPRSTNRVAYKVLELGRTRPLQGSPHQATQGPMLLSRAAHSTKERAQALEEIAPLFLRQLWTPS
jgi:hypothetical protein